MVSSSHSKKPRLPLAPGKKKGKKVKTLTLWLKTDPFCRFLQGLKDKEYRRRSGWIEQRLFETDYQETDENSPKYIADEDIRTIDANLYIFYAQR